MKIVALFSSLLLLGLAVSQMVDLSPYMTILTNITLICLAYIMIDVGLEFQIDKGKWAEFSKDYLIAATAAAFPWIFCAFYFIYFLDTPLKEAWLVSRFAAPTSAGILFAMLVAAGLGTTWVFKKVQVLAIFDDLDTILLMIPLQVMLVGFKFELAIVIVFIFIFLWLAYRYLHQWTIPSSKLALFMYAVAIVVFCEVLEHTTHIHMEVLIPAFCLGCMIKTKSNHHLGSQGLLSFDNVLKAVFMLLVGCSLPKIDFGSINWVTTLGHVLAITVISNIGKCFPILCYRSQASFKERLAIAVSLFPRGEVGAGVLLIAIGYNFTGMATTVAGLSLALNLVLTGVFIMFVIGLLKDTATPREIA